MYVMDYNNINVESTEKFNNIDNSNFNTLNLSNYGFKFNGEDESEKLEEVIKKYNPEVIMVPRDKTLTIGKIDIFNDNFTIRNYGKIKICNYLQMWGNNSGIIGGTIEGNLKIAQLAEESTNGGKTLVLKNNPFNVGESVYIRKSLGNLDGDKIEPKVVSCNGNSIQVDTLLNNDSVKNSYVGNFRWESTLCFRGNNFIKDCKIINCSGYAMCVKGILDCENISIDKNGMDMIDLEGELYADNLNLGYSYADSTQGISITKDNSKLYLKNSIIKRNNCDADIYIYGEIKNIKCSFINCEFDGTYDSSICFRPEGKDKGGTSILEMAVVRDSSKKNPIQSIDNLYFEQCNIHNYNQAVLNLFKASDLDNNYKIKSYVSSNCKFINIGIITNNSSLLKVDNYEFNSCIFRNNEYYEGNKYCNDLGNLDGKIKFNNCKFYNFRDKIDDDDRIIYNKCRYWDLVKK